MLLLEDVVIVDGQVSSSGNLLLTTGGGDVIDAGPVKGDTGPSGNDPAVTINFAAPSTTWVCNHNLGKKIVDVILSDNNGDAVMGDIKYVDENTLTVSWFYPQAGTVVIQP
jgi:hypothetical protein